MADIRPFQGLRYNGQNVGEIAQVISPPYDVISAEQKRQLLEQNACNVVRLILPDGAEPYTRANETFQTWIQEKVLIRDPEPAIYCYHQTYVTPENEKRTREGFLSLIRLENFENRVVLPHETTLSAPKEDRLQLLRACKANFSPIFSLYSDPQEQIEELLKPATASSPEISARTEDGILNQLWLITDRKLIHRIQEIMKNRWVLIADGHHRYESCLMYRDERRQEDLNPEAPFQFTLMYFCNLNHPGITVLPYNRAVHGLPQFDPESIRKKAAEYFHVQAFASMQQAMFQLKQASQDTTAFIARYQDSESAYVYQLKDPGKLSSYYPDETPVTFQKLDVNVLHKIFLEVILNISLEELRQQKYLKYYKNEQEENNDFESGKLQIAFFLNPTRVDQVVEVSQSGKNMPQKSTFFYPKLMTGLVMRSM